MKSAFKLLLLASAISESFLKLDPPQQLLLEIFEGAVELENDD
jgi:hypothetical protein